jgi:hypothetical protein
LIGTPYHAKARKPGVGVDCVGMPILTCWIAGVHPWGMDFTDYPMQPDGSLLPRCDANPEYLQPVTQAEMAPGDIVVLRWGKEPHHFGVVADDKHGRLTIVHAENWRHKKVVEHRMCFTDNAMKFVAAYRLPGVEA